MPCETALHFVLEVAGQKTYGKCLAVVWLGIKAPRATLSMPRRAQRSIGFNLVQQCQHAGSDALQGFAGVAFKAQYQYGGGVAGADEAKAVGPVYAHAVYGVDADLRLPYKDAGGQCLQGGGEAVGFAFGAGHVDFGRAVASGQGV